MFKTVGKSLAPIRFSISVALTLETGKYGVEAIPSHDDDKLGIALETIGKTPINGLRHKVENGTCGWYIWCGEEFSQDSDFFKPLHVKHHSCPKTVLKRTG